MSARFATWLVALTLAGCSGDDDGSASAAIAAGKLSGKVGGQSWTVASAETDAVLSDADELWVDLYDQPATTACGSNSRGGNSLILTVPRSPGDYRLSWQLNGTFVIETPSGTDNLVGTEGRLRVDEVTATTLRAGVTIEFDADNTLSGEFEAVICAD
jgi:hypothetical protein